MFGAGWDKAVAHWHENLTKTELQTFIWKYLGERKKGYTNLKMCGKVLGLSDLPKILFVPDLVCWHLIIFTPPNKYGLVLGYYVTLFACLASDKLLAWSETVETSLVIANNCCLKLGTVASISYWSALISTSFRDKYTDSVLNFHLKHIKSYRIDLY